MLQKHGALVALTLYTVHTHIAIPAVLPYNTAITQTQFSWQRPHTTLDSSRVYSTYRDCDRHKGVTARKAGCARRTRSVAPDLCGARAPYMCMTMS